MTLYFNRLPFHCEGLTDLAENWSEWIGTVFYDILPEHGFEIRDEQIYTTFQISTAMQQSRVHLAEAGLGTGKTFAYLVNGLIQARLTNQPVIISCASAVLQDQLAGANGDIAVLADALGLEIDVRVAKPFDQYICDTKVERLRQLSATTRGKLAQALSWAIRTKTGDRAEIPQLPDKIWAKIAWDESEDCENCSARGYCRKTKAHNQHRLARDFIICDHEFFFADLWSRREREAEGFRPFLPEYSGVVFDEGHKIFLPAARAAGKELIRDELDSMLLRLEKLPDARDSLLAAVVAVEDAADGFYQILASCVMGDERSERLTVRISPALQEDALKLQKTLRALEFELETERSLFNEDLPPALLKLFDARIGIFGQGLRLFANATADTIAWIEREDESLWVVPRSLQEFLAEHLFSRQLPVVFSSATLSTGKDFRYITAKLGLTESPVELTTSSIGSPFEPEEQVLVYLPRQLESSIDELVALLEISQGRALVLTADLAEVKKIRTALKDRQKDLEFGLLWEDLAERAYLLQTFKDDIPSVLVGSSFWEGIDVPGEALSLVVIWSLPFPPTRDPILDSLRSAAAARGADAAETVDYPEMALRLKQGCGRLIRASNDRGVIAILAPFSGTPCEKHVLSALPDGAPVTSKVQDVIAFFS